MRITLFFWTYLIHLTKTVGLVSTVYVFAYVEALPAYKLVLQTVTIPSIATTSSAVILLRAVAYRQRSAHVPRFL
jgi:hypothetical protein